MRIYYIVLPIAAIISPTSCGAGSTQLETLEQRGSYAVGVSVGRDLLLSGADFDIDALQAGLRDALAESQTELSEEEMARAFQELSTAARSRARDEAAMVNLDEGAAFLQENGAREGVSTTASGLQYEVLTEGTGPRPEESDRVGVNYVGTLIDGTEFDASRDPGQPAIFGVGEVISGWTEGLQLMSVGSVYKFFIPASLAYGVAGSGQRIGPNATLIFEVTLLSIQ